MQVSFQTPRELSDRIAMQFGIDFASQKYRQGPKGSAMCHGALFLGDSLYRSALVYTIFRLFRVCLVFHARSPSFRRCSAYQNALFLGFPL